MLAKALVIAMAADIARSDYAKPTLIRSRSREWLIACRWGPDGEYLSIATAGALAEPLAKAAPQAIKPIHSLFGLLISRSRRIPPAPSCWCVSCLVGSNLPARSFPPMGMWSCSNMPTSISSARHVTRTAAAGSTAGKSARTFPIRHLPRPKRCPGISRRRGVTGSANSFREQCRESGSRSALPADGVNIRRHAVTCRKRAAARN